jgi:hypothetical protein
MIGDTEKALHTPVPGTPIHDDLVAKFANLVQSSERIGAIKERQAILEYLVCELETIKQPGTLKVLNRIAEWVSAR